MTDLATLLRACPGPPAWTPGWPDVVAGFAWARALYDCPQDPHHHAEGDVGLHTDMVLQALAAMPAFRALPEAERHVVFLASLLHDVAKPATTRVEDDGRVTARGHSIKGAIFARRILWGLGLDAARREQVCGLIAHHQLPFFLVEKEPADAERRAITASLVARCDHLALVTEADARGRVCADQARLLDNTALFRVACAELGCLDAAFPFASDHSRFLWCRTPGREKDYRAHDDTAVDVTLLSGLPGAGKDTWLARHAGDRAVVSLDALRATLDVDPAASQGVVVHAAREAAREFLRERRAFVWNATNLSRDVRSQIIDLCAGYGARVRVVALEVDEATLRRRNHARAARVPDAVIDRLLGRWEAPDLTEAHAVERVVDQ